MASPIYEMCDTYIERLAALDPAMATSRGLLGHDTELTDYSPEGSDARAALDRATLAGLEALEPAGDRDRVAAGLLAEWLQSRLAMEATGESLRGLRVIGSPFQTLRQVFDLMPHESAEDWAALATRMELVPDRLRGLRDSYVEAIARDLAPARRQVLACAAQGAAWAGRGERPPFFADLVSRYGGDDGTLQARLEEAATRASDAYGSISDWMRETLAPASSPHDPVGAERYTVAARQSLGSTIDPREIYRWGWDELHELEAEMAAVADEIAPGASVPEVIDLLEHDPERAVHGEEALRAYLQDLMDSTIEALDGVHFDIPGPLKWVEAMIAPPGGAAAMYYTGPSEDFSRPGRTWYPTLGKAVFPLWGEISTCYHEGVPGHHLQIGQVRYLRDDLSRFQRAAGIAGHSEGWALYSERLMDELGFFEKPEYRLGYLRGQTLRAVRVVVDIGMHLELEIPAADQFHPGERWTPDLGEQFLFERSCFPRDFMSSELERYLGWPGQAISYKVGQRVWLSARDGARRRLGNAFDLKAFHAHALGLGPLGLDQLAAEAAAWTAGG